MLLLPGQGTFESLGSLDTRLNEQVTHQARASGFRFVVQGMMQLHTILFAVLPSVDTHGIERLGKLHKRFLQGFSLLRSGMQVYSHRSVHAESIPYMSSFYKCENRRGGVSSHSPEGEEYPRRNFLW